MKQTFFLFAALFFTMFSANAQTDYFAKLSDGSAKTWVCASVSTGDAFNSEQKAYLKYTHVGAKWSFFMNRDATVELPLQSGQMNPTLLKATYGFAGKKMGFSYTEWSEPKANDAWMNYQYVISFPRSGEMKAEAYQFNEATFEDVYMFTIHFEEE